MQASVLLSHPADRQGGSGFRGGGSTESLGVSGCDESASVPEGVDVVVEADGRAGGPAVCVTACVAAAALDPQHVVEALSVGAVEAEPHGAGQRWGAAAAVGASATGARAIPWCCGASGEGDTDRFLRADGSLTLLPLASYRKQQLTMADLAQSGFSDQPTVGVVIGHPT